MYPVFRVSNIFDEKNRKKFLSELFYYVTQAFLFANNLIRLVLWQFLHLPQLTPHYVRARADERIELFVRRANLLLRLFQGAGEFIEFGLYSAEHFPDLDRALLYRKRLETHLQGVQEGGERRRARYRNAEIALQGFK
jgi:hypothetical protein